MSELDDMMPPDPFGPEPAPRARRLDPDGRPVLELSLELVPLNLDDPDLAEWCEPCLLPSAIGYRFRILVDGRPAPGRSTLTLTVCRDCGGHTRRTS